MLQIAKRIYERLVTECGFVGGETTVRRLVRELREKHQEAFMSLAFLTGDMQIDWGEATGYLKGVETTINLFCTRFCYSGEPMVMIYRRQNEESFLNALFWLFPFFGDVPRRVIITDLIHVKVRVFASREPVFYSHFNLLVYILDTL